MATIDVQARELTGVQVEFISLVKRGANRLPFRIMKGDRAMLDLASYFRKQDNQQVVEEAKLAKSDEALQMAQALLAKSGFAIFSPSQVQAFQKAGLEIPTGQADPRADDGSNTMGNPDAPGKNPANGSTPGLGGNDDDGDPSPQEPDSPGKNPVLMNAAVNKIPAAGLGIDVPMTKTAADPMDANNDDPGAAPTDTSTVTLDKSGKTKKADATGENPAAESEQALENAENANQTAVAARETAQKSDTELKAMFATLTKSVENLATQMTHGFQKTDATVADLGKRVATTEAAFQKTDSRLAALIPGQAQNDTVVPVRKADKHIPLLDTAFMKP